MKGYNKAFEVGGTNYDIIANKNFRTLDSESLRSWLTLRKTALSERRADIGILFANAYLLNGSDTATQVPANANSGVLADLKRATRKLGKFLGKDLSKKASFTNKDLEKLVQGMPANLAIQYFYYCFDVFTAVLTTKFLEVSGAEIANAFMKIQASQTKPVAEDIKKQCRAKVGFSSKEIAKKEAFNILYALAKQAEVKDLPEIKTKEAGT